MRAWLHVQGIEHATPADLEEVERIARDLEVDPDELSAIFALESGWNPAAHNTIRAGGLIGFMPDTLSRLGWTDGPEAFWRLSIAEQLPYVRDYFRLVRQANSREWLPGDSYVATFWPTAIGQTDDYVIAAPDSQGFLAKVWEQNPALRAGPTGSITAGSVRGVLLRIMSRAAGNPRYSPVTGLTTIPSAGVADVLVVALAAGLIWLLRRKRSQQ